MAFRFFILFLAWFLLTSIASNVNVFNVARLCMNGNQTDPNSIKYTERDYNNLILASAFGTLFFTLPFNWIYTKFGARFVFFGAGIVSIFSTALVPLCAQLGFLWLYVARFVQGIAYSSDFAAMGLVSARWSPLQQAAFFISVLTCYTSLSALVSSPITGLLCASGNWQWTFYLHSIACFVLLLLWLYFYRDNPRESPFVNAKELEQINRNKSKAHVNMDKSIPYKRILADLLVWTIWINAFFEIASGVFSLTYQPLFLKNVLKFDITKTGFLAVSGPVFHIPLKFIFGMSSDRIRCCSEATKMRIFNTIAVFLPGFCYLGLSFIPIDMPWLHVAMFSLIGITFSAAGGGFYKCATLYSRQYSPFLIANIQVVKALTMLLGPLLMNWLVEDVSQQLQWRYIFVPMAISVFISNCLFLWLVTDQAASFTHDSLEVDAKPSFKISTHKNSHN